MISSKYDEILLLFLHQDFLKFLRFDKSAEILNSLLVIKLFDKCDECYAVNKEIARIFHEEYHCKNMPKVMNNATEMVPVERSKARSELAKKYDIKEEDKVFSFVGRINTLKNILFIVDALKIVKDSGMSFKMLFIGTGEDEDKLKNKIEECNLEDSVILCGKITDREMLAKHYAASDLFLFPSKYDASSLVQIEAACQGTPTVFIKNTATSSTATDNVNAFMTTDSPKSYAKKIIQVLNDEELYNKVSTNAKKDLYKTWDQVVEEIYKIYLDNIKRKEKEK